MSDELRCPECLSNQIIPDVRIVDHGEADVKMDLAVELYRKPDALVFKGAKKGVLLATICGECGRVDLRVENPRELWRIYRAHYR